MRIILQPVWHEQLHSITKRRLINAFILLLPTILYKPLHKFKMMGKEHLIQTTNYALLASNWHNKII
jgi:hypothetical protein